MSGKLCGIYYIKSLINNKTYIGQSMDIKLRFRYHKSDLNCNVHHNKHLQHAWNKYGEENFIFGILELCDESMLSEREKYYIKLYNSFGKEGYNKTSGGDGMCGTTQYEIWVKNYGVEEADKRRNKMADKISKAHKGKIVSEKQKKKQSEIMKGKLVGEKNSMYGKCGKLNHKYGTHQSEETRKKISESHKGKEPSLEHKFNSGYKLLRVNEEQIKEVFQRLQNNDSMLSIARDLNVSRDTISKIKNYEDNFIFKFILQKLGLVQKDDSFNLLINLI